MSAAVVPGDLLGLLEESADRTDVTGLPDRAALARLRGSGLLATAVPVEHGGRGGGARDVNAVVAELARVNPSVAIIAFQHFAVTARLVEWAPEALRAEILPRLADGRCLAASAWSEPGAGAAKRSIASTGVRRPDGTWVVDGAKSYTTGASVADVYLVLVRTGADAPAGGTGYGAAGQTFFLVDAADPGVAPQPGIDLVGMRGSATGFVTLRGCVVPDGRRIGPEGAAAQIIAGVRETGATLGAVAVGVAQAALDLLHARLREHGRLGGDLVRHRLVELATRLEAARGVVDRAGARTAPDPGAATLHSKLFASTVAEEICLEAARLLGSEAYSAVSRLNRMLDDVRGVGLMGPTNELCREILAARWAA